MSTNSKIHALYSSRIKEDSSMQHFAKYIEDEKFISWVYHPTLETENYWSSHMKMNPSEKDTILFLKDSLLALKTEERTLSNLEKKVILSRIEKDIKSRKKRPYLKYAAAILILLSLGASILNTYKKRNPSFNPDFNALKTAAIDTISNTQLILGSGRHVAVRSEKSTVKYANNGEIVINNKDTLKGGTNKVLDIETFNQLLVPFGKKSQIALSDGSIVHLNSGSKLIFPEVFLKNQRRVFLDGEAFFEVESDTERPFFVQSLNSKTEIMAVGTKFNVTAYSSDEQIRTVLVEGKVNLVESENPDNEIATMQPRELAEWDKKQKGVMVVPVDVYPYISWMDGILILKSEPFDKVIKKVERFYNIELEYDRGYTKPMTITGKLDLNEDIGKTLENIKMTLSIKYQKINDNKYKIEK